MKTAVVILVSFLLCIQSKAQQLGAIYSFSFRVADDLTQNEKVEDKSRSVFSEVSVSDDMPQQLIDSIKKEAEDVFSKKLSMPVKLCFRKNKKGEEIGSTSIGGLIAGLPDNTLNKGKEQCPGSSRYVYLDVQIYPSSGISTIIAGEKKSKLKPKLQITAKVYNENKDETLKKQVVIKDFASLRSRTEFYGSVEVTNSETLSPYDIYAMYMIGMEKLFE